ncbi:MAG: gephyrin-like molybdotransferase Glp [Gammaproteobacteria bacterium]
MDPMSHHPCNNDLLEESQALARLLDAIVPVPETETVALEQALGRVLANSLMAVVDVPPFDNSAMDGYALACADLPAPGETTLPVSQRVAAGDRPAPLRPGSAARIFTGAPLPPRADTVVMQEQCRVQEGHVVIKAPLTVGSHIRRLGEDLRSGEQILAAGTRLQPQHLGLAASSGSAALEVFRRPRIATLFTGNELIPPGTPLAPGKIYNSNRYTLHGLLQNLGCEVTDLGIIGDDYELTLEALVQAATGSDLILTSGGASVGEEDHIKNAITTLGRLELWRIAVKPGKPLAFGHIGETPLLGLPGNPVSLFITFCLFARPALRKLQGCGEWLPRRLWATADFTRRNAIARSEYLRARLSADATGCNRVALHPQQGSAILSSTTWADCLAVVPANTTVSPGQAIEVIPFSELLY